jgi:copper chaperone NosL
MSNARTATPVNQPMPRAAEPRSAAPSFLEKATLFFDLPLRGASRIVTLLATLLLIPALLFPLWSMTLYSNQFPDGLNLYIYANSLQGGHPTDRDDLKEINTLNHYIGMHALAESDFTEFKWIPLMLGLFFILGLRTIVIGKMSNLVDTAVLFGWFGIFSLWSFYSKLWLYGHSLDPTAAVKVPPFMPPMFGSRQLANFTVYSFPGAASYFLFGFLVLLGLAAALSRRRTPAGIEPAAR